MLSFDHANEEEAFKDFVRRFKNIPDDELDQYACKHEYMHTEDCRICSFTLEVA